MHACAYIIVREERFFNIKCWIFQLFFVLPYLLLALLISILPPRHSPKSSIFWHKFGIKIPLQTPTTLDFPRLFQKSNFLPWQMNKTLIITFSYHSLLRIALFCKVLSAFWTSYFPSLKIHFLPNKASCSNSLPYVVVKS